MTLLLSADAGVMVSGVACCQANLRAWISVVVVVQCVLILLYWDVTRTQSSSSRPLRLQSRAGPSGQGGPAPTDTEPRPLLPSYGNPRAPPRVKVWNRHEIKNEAAKETSEYTREFNKDSRKPDVLRYQSKKHRKTNDITQVHYIAQHGDNTGSVVYAPWPPPNDGNIKEDKSKNTPSPKSDSQLNLNKETSRIKLPTQEQNNTNRVIQRLQLTAMPRGVEMPNRTPPPSHVVRVTEQQARFDPNKPEVRITTTVGGLWRSNLEPHIHSPIDTKEKINYTDPYAVNSRQVFNIDPIEDFSQRFPTLPVVFQLPPGDKVFSQYFIKNGADLCFTGGTAHASQGAGQISYNGCLCEKGWHGRYCSIPESVYFSTGSRFVEALKPRNISRRVVSAVAFNMEFELLEARLHELHDVVDVFIILESNYTNYGEAKPLRLLQKMRDGYLKQFHSKILYLFWGRFPSGGREDGWIVDQYMRMFIGQAGMRRVLNTRPDDIFLYTDADELPSREAILFLRMHDGYSEPFGISLRWSVFGFFWRQLDTTRVMIGCTVGMFRYVFKNDGYQLRSGDYQAQSNRMLNAYVKSGAFVYEWHLGDNSAFAGWHCSWCLPPVRVRTKLTSAINADFPRWGDFPEKLQLSYLRHLIKSGTWFDDKTRFGRLVNWKEESKFAPNYLLQNFNKFKYLLNLDDV